SCKRKEVAASTDDPNDPLDDIIIPQSKNAGIKKGYKQQELDASSLNDYDNNTQSKSKKGHKKTHKTAIS
ncbi:18409_t:CDS:1, partial [Dentiscutata erythropus]